MLSSRVASIVDLIGSLHSALGRASSSVSNDRKVSGKGWSKHLEDGVLHVAAPLSMNLSFDLKAMLTSKGALQCVEKFIMDVKVVPKHSTFKKGYNVEGLKPIAGQYAGRLELVGISMFFCSFTHANHIPHQWFEFVDREVNPTYMPRERVELPVVFYASTKSSKELAEEDALDKGTGSSSTTFNEDPVDSASFTSASSNEVCGESESNSPKPVVARAARVCASGGQKESPRRFIMDDGIVSI